VIFTSNMSQLLTNMYKQRDRSMLEGKVQLILTDPNKYEFEKEGAKIVEISTIVKNCAKLLKKGGHVFIMTDIMQAAQFITAFKVEKKDTEEAVFTVGESLYTLLARPEDEVGAAGEDGPRTSVVTKYMVHATKLGGSNLKESLENIDLRWQANTKTYYHASTNAHDGALTKTDKKTYDLSLGGTQEIIERYSLEGDTVVDFCCDQGWTAMACITIPNSRIFVGATENAEKTAQVRHELSNSIIYQVGKGEITTGMDYDEEMIIRMKKEFEVHDFANRYHSGYGLKPWLKTRYAENKLPMLTSIPPYLLTHIAGMQFDQNLRPRFTTLGSPCGMPKDIAIALSRTPSSEVLRVAASKYELMIDRSNRYDMEGCMTLGKKTMGECIGHLHGVIINGEWDLNKEALQEFGFGLFEYDEYIVQKKNIPIENTKKIVDLHHRDKKQLQFIPSATCPFRYAEFVQEGGNTKIKHKLAKNREVELKQLAMYNNLEVVVTKLMKPGEKIILNISSLKL